MQIRWVPRYSLRFFVILIVLLGCGLGWLANATHRFRQEWAAAELLATKYDALLSTDRSDAWLSGQVRPIYRSFGLTKGITYEPIAQVSLSGVTLDDAAFDALETFGSLERIDIERCRFETSGGRLAQLTNIKDLSLFNPVPRNELEGLSTLSQLTSLEVDGAVGTMTVADTEAITRLPNLEGLSISRMPISEKALHNIGRMNRLTFLRFSNVSFGELALDSVLESRIETLWLWETDADDHTLRRLDQLQKARTLFLDHATVGEPTFEKIGRLPHLKLLSVQHTESFTDDALRHLTGLSHLENLQLDNTPVTDAGAKYLAQISSLKSLSLENTPITDRGVQHLLSHPRLESVFLEGTRLSPKMVQKLDAERPWPTTHLPDLVPPAEAMEKR